jgi:glucosamine--fructose-6-phosphate aminotransferase (isomerizing)
MSNETENWPCDAYSRMRHEIEEIPDALRRLLSGSNGAIFAAAHELKKLDPRFVTTIARGSSDHAASYLKYAIELVANIPVASIGPSIASIYGVSLRLERSVSISISQSGKSPDIIQMAKSAAKSGALTLALVNDNKAPLGNVCAHTIDICAGAEISVAATKTFVTSITTGLLLLAHWKDDQNLLDALHALPEQASRAIQCNWQQLNDRLKNEKSLLILGRGPSLAIAKEVALKFKETCQIHAEAYSSAEVLHRPVSIVKEGYPIIALIARDASQISIAATADQLAKQGADIFATSKQSEKSKQLDYIETGHPLTDPLLLIISFYSFIEKLARQRGLNPDLPPNLNKVTKTV